MCVKCIEVCLVSYFRELLIKRNYYCWHRVLTFLPESKPGKLTIPINTVDSFQGSEADIVLYSVVQTRGNLRLIPGWKRLNVACSRARENLIFFSDFNFLKSKRDSNERNLFIGVIAQIPPEGIILVPGLPEKRTQTKGVRVNLYNGVFGLKGTNAE
ncbi:AAA domain-containing protein [Phytobacter palmae]|uniref:AAA domain-containing protein n=1 Tax=Phytobacter palmae TaxID=1855371 RepID=UPI003CCDE423